MSEDLRRDDEYRYKGPHKVLDKHKEHDKDCHCDKCNYDDFWKDDKDCDKDKDKNCDKDKDKNNDCCCDIDTLRKILELFVGKNIIVEITTRNNAFEGFISNVSQDVVDISETFGDTPIHFIPLCTVVRFFADVSDLTQEDRVQLRNTILSFIHSTLNLDPCCCADEIATKINSIKRSNNTSSRLCFNINTTANLSSNSNNCFDLNDILRANKDIVFAIFQDDFFIYPTCGIDSMFIQMPV